MFTVHIYDLNSALTSKKKSASGVIKKSAGGGVIIPKPAGQNQQVICHLRTCWHLSSLLAIAVAGVVMRLQYLSQQFSQH